MKIILLFGLLTSFLFCDVNWKSYEQMQSDFNNKKINKPILLFIAKSDCPYCAEEKKAMDNSAEYSSFANNNYYNVYVDIDKTEVSQAYNATYFPTIYALNPENIMPMVPEPVLGAVNIEEMTAYIKALSKRYNQYIEEKK